MNKTKHLTWAVVLLVVLNLTTITTILYHNYKESTEKETIVLGNESNNMLNGRFFRQTIGFNNSQMVTFREANREFRPKANGIILQIDSLKNEIFLELKKANSDTVRLNNLSLETGALHSQLKKETNRFYLKIKTVCTPQQIEQLQTTFTPLFHNAPCDGKGISGRCKQQ
jgi:GTPase SAR1 family protein